MTKTLYTTTRQTLVERIPYVAESAPFLETPRKRRTPKPTGEYRNPIIDAVIPLVLCDADGCAFKQWTEESGLVLTVARTSKAAAEVLAMVEGAFPRVKA